VNEEWEIDRGVDKQPIKYVPTIIMLNAFLTQIWIVIQVESSKLVAASDKAWLFR
jgi:hypothetical protein